jgi:hypothetical protein
MIKSFLDGFIKGAQEAPRGFFMPAIMLWKFLGRTIDAILVKKFS